MGEINGHALLFLFFGLLTCLFSLAVVFSANVVRMAFYLVISLAAVAGLYFICTESEHNTWLGTDVKINVTKTIFKKL